jgi:hypothetical protein
MGWVERRLRRNARWACMAWIVSAAAFVLMTGVDVTTENGGGNLAVQLVSTVVALWFVLALLVWWMHLRALHDWQTGTRTWREGR